MGATVGILAGVGAAVGAGGGAGSAFGSSVKSPVQDPLNNAFTTGLNPGADPLVVALTLQSFADIGQVPPRELLLQGGPATSAISQVVASRGANTREIEKVNRGLAQAIANYRLTGDPEGGEGISGDAYNILKEAAGNLGLTIEQLLQNQIDFESSVDNQLNALQRRSEQGMSTRQAADAGLQELLTNLPSVSLEGINAIRDQELARIKRDVNTDSDQMVLDQLRSANAANYNPGRIVGDIEKQRLNRLQDADLDALGRAVALLSGEQNLAVSRQTQLQNILQVPAINAQNLARIRVGSVAPGASILEPQQIVSDPVGDIVGGLLGGGLAGGKIGAGAGGGS